MLQYRQRPANYAVVVVVVVVLAVVTVDLRCAMYSIPRTNLIYPQSRLDFPT